MNKLINNKFEEFYYRIMDDVIERPKNRVQPQETEAILKPVYQL